MARSVFNAWERTGLPGEGPCKNMEEGKAEEDRKRCKGQAEERQDHRKREGTWRRPKNRKEPVNSRQTAKRNQRGRRRRETVEEEERGFGAEKEGEDQEK